MTKKTLSVYEIYTLGGVLFGLSFPVFSQFIDCLHNGLDFTWSSIVIIHQRNIIHYVVDTAPIVLGAAGFLLGSVHKKKNDINNKLRQINESLDTLTYKITHDLRGPALNIKNLAEILTSSKQTLPVEKKELILQKIHESVATWLQTFEDFMSLLRHEKSGELTLENCKLETVVSQLQAELKNEIEESGLSIETDFGRSPMVFASEIYLNSIFKNLLTNAIKYAHMNRPPEVKISSSTEEKMIKITFSDNGSGINLDTHGDKIFGLFERFSENSGIPGSGIGLYLVKEQVDKNNGTIQVHSVPNEGTTFIIHLPTSS